MMLSCCTILGLLLASCDYWHDSYEGCEELLKTHLKVQFIYDMNMKFADAFPHEVKNVTLYAFDQQGKLAYVKAKAAKLDTLTSFKKEFLGYRDQQVRPSFINDADVEAEARKIYRETQQRIDSTGGLIKPAHILFMARQRDPQAKWDEAQQRADSVYNVLLHGGNFAELAKKYSQDPGSAKKGGELGWLQKGALVKEFEDAAYSMKKGDISKPVKTPFGYHIIKLEDKRMFFPYDSVKADIHRFIEQRGLREMIINQKLDSLAKANPGTKGEDFVDKRLAEMEQKDPNLKYLVQEYHDGLLLYEISNRTVWDKAAKDEAGLEAFFKKNKKNYKWDAPRFKGIAYHVKKQADVENVKNAVKGQPFPFLLLVAAENVVLLPLLLMQIGVAHSQFPDRRGGVHNAFVYALCAAHQIVHRT